MRFTGFACVLVLVFSGFAVAQTPAAGPVPPGILNAKTVFVANGGSDAGLFPEPFSGDQNWPYAAFYARMKSLARYELVTDPSQADVVMQIELIAPTGPQRTSKLYGAADPLPYLRLTIYDRKTQFALWTLTEAIDIAVLQKTHDRNFDQAVDRIVGDLQALATPGATQLYPDAAGTRPRNRHGLPEVVP